MLAVLRWLKSPIVIFVLIAFAIAAAIGLVRHHNQQQAAQRRLATCRFYEKANKAQGTSPVTVGTTKVAVLGDGLAQGAGLPHLMRQAWPALLGAREHWTTIVNADARSGFVAGGYCGGQRFGKRVAQVLSLHVNTVIVEGGTGDLAHTSILNFAAKFQRSVKKLLHQLAGISQVIVVGPLPVGSTVSPEERTLDKVLRRNTDRDGRTYVSALHWQLPETDKSDQADARNQAAIADYLSRSLSGTVVR